MPKSVCSEAPIFGEIRRLSGYPGGIEMPVTGTGTLRAAQAAHRKYKSSSEPASAGGTGKSWYEPSPLRTTHGETWRGETNGVIRPSLPAFSHPCLTVSCEKLKTGCCF